jgi:branched-chain amino acid transport system substrate-binding protein
MQGRTQINARTEVQAEMQLNTRPESQLGAGVKAGPGSASVGDLRRLSVRQFALALGAVSLVSAGCTRKAPDSGAPGASGATGSAATASAEEIVIGEFGSFTGSEATFGKSTSEGIKMAVDEINAKGGVKGKKVRLVSTDTESKNELAPAAIERLITQSKVVAVIGEVASARSLLAAPIAQKYKIPMISPASTNPKVTEVGEFVFRTCFIDPFQGTVMAKFAFENLKLKRVAILRDIKAEYSVGLAQFFKKKFLELGGEIVSEQDYQGGDLDFKAQLTQIRSAKPDAIFIPGYYGDVGMIAKNVRQLGIKAALLGGDGWDSASLTEIGGDAINGGYFSNHYTTESTEPVVQDFIKRFKERTGGSPPDAMSALGYDAARILFEAMERAPDLSGQAIRDEIAKTKDFKGVTGTITIDEKRNASKSAVVVRVDGKVFRYVTTIAP